MSETCKHPGCVQPKGKALGWCNAHYSRARKGKDMDPPIRNAKASDRERFWAKVEKSEDCWAWTGAITMGYGIFRINGGNQVAHRVSYRWARGPIPEGAEVDHMCFNRACVNPDHLRLLTHTMNGQNRASANKNSKTGIRGVYWNAGRRGWMSAGYLGDDIHRFGPFAEIEQAEKAIVEWRREHMPASINDQRKAG